MDSDFTRDIRERLSALRSEGLYKEERPITSAQQAVIRVAHSEVINLCSNNYLGLANDPQIAQAAREGMEARGFGLASVRFICGTQDIHKELEGRLRSFLGTEDTILYSSCFDANTGLFETLLGPEDAVISDALNHASIIDGIRLCKAQRYRYANNDMAALEARLQEADAAGARYKLIVTDGVFSMDGVIANLQGICDLADTYRALVMVDDSHAVGVMGAAGRGSHEYCGVLGRVDILTGTLGKALGGASGGYTSGRQEIIDWLRQRSRPYLFSNTLAPAVVTASLKALELLQSAQERLERLHANSHLFRREMLNAGFALGGADHPIIPVLIGDAALAAEMAKRLFDHGVYVIGFSFPVVPRGEARIRTQVSALHTSEQLELAVTAFQRVGRELGIVA